MNQWSAGKMLGAGLLSLAFLGHARAALVDNYSFDESASGTGTAFDSGPGANPNSNGTFQGTATRTAGLVGTGAALFNETNGDAVDVGNTFSASTGIEVSAVIKPTFAAASTAYHEIFRKEDGGNRILFAFQNDSNGGGAQPAVGAGPVLSFGLNVGGYNELDMLLDGSHGVTLNTPAPAGGVELEDGNAHTVVASYDSVSGIKAIYIDGILRDMVNETAGTLISSGGVTDATIGNVGVGGNEPFAGVIDEVKLYNSAVPEPASLSLLSLAGLGLLTRRRRA